MREVAELTEKIGLVKDLLFWGDRNILFTASERQILLWDTVSLKNVGAMRVLKSDVKCLEMAD